MKKVLLVTCCLMGVLCSKPQLVEAQQNKLVQASKSSSINWPAFLAQHDLRWNKMPTNYYEGPFAGNGLLGTVFFKDTLLPNTIGFEIGRTDVYDHRTAEQIKGKYPWPKVRLPIGKLLLQTAGTITGVNFRTNLWDAEITGTITTDKGSISLMCYVPSGEKVIVVNLNGTAGEQSVNVSFRPEQGNNARAPRRPMSGKVYEPNPPFVLADTLHIQTITQPLLNGDDYATAWNKQLSANGSTSVYITVANKWAEGLKPSSGSCALAVAQLLAARNKSEQQMLQQHRQWWHQYYPASFVSIPDARIEGFYWLQQYRLASAGRPDKPPIDLMGPWYKPSVWLAMWANLNIQLTYYTTGITNHLDMEEPYFKMIEKYQDQLINNVPPNFRNDCAAVQTVVMFNDLSGNVSLTADSASKQKMSLIALPWIMQQFYIHYRLTMDTARLRSTIYPLMKRAFNVYLRVMYKGADGKYHLPLTFSDEYGEDKDANMNLALAKWGFKTLLSCAEKLQIKDTLMPHWKDALENMVSYATDSTGLRIGRYLPFNKPHRHYSHLFSIFPLYEMNVDNDKEAITVMEKSIQHFTSLDGDNCMFKFNGAASLWAATGNGNQALFWLQRSLQILSYSVPTVTPNGFYSENGWPTFESPIASCRSVLDMLLQSWGKYIRIFPAMPDTWKEGVFNNLLAEGGFTVGAERKNGKTSWVSVTSNAGEPCIIQVKDWDGPLACNIKGVTIQYLGNGAYKIDLKKKQSVVVYPSATQPKIDPQPIPHTPNSWKVWGLNQ